MNSTLHLLGIARKAGKLELGEEPTGAAARARQAKLILVARDAADNTFRRVRHFADAGNVLWVSVPFTKAEMGSAVGRTSCAMLAVMDPGLAAAMVKKLAAEDPEKYAITAEKLEEKAQRALQRQREKRAHEKNLREGKRKPWAPHPKEAPSAKKQSRPPRKKEGEETARPAGRSGRPAPKGKLTLRGKLPTQGKLPSQGKFPTQGKLPMQKKTSGRGKAPRRET